MTVAHPETRSLPDIFPKYFYYVEVDIIHRFLEAVFDIVAAPFRQDCDETEAPGSHADVLPSQTWRMHGP